MHTIIRTLLGSSLDEQTLRLEVEFLTDSLEALRHEGAISNDAYLDAGTIQGGLAMVANLAALDVDKSELIDHMQQLAVRADRIEAAHPGLDDAIASKR